jgi:hypothetical protein
VIRRRTNGGLASLVRVDVVNEQLKMNLIRPGGCVPYTVMHIFYKFVSSKNISKSSRSSRLESVLSASQSS